MTAGRYFKRMQVTEQYIEYMKEAPTNQFEKDFNDLEE